MTRRADSPVILVADDDADDRVLLREAAAEAGLSWDLRAVGDGEELLDVLSPGGVTPGARRLRPRLILLDLNMPRKDGREALAAIKSDEALRDIPVVVLTTSRSDDDVATCYRLGAASYISKPRTFRDLVRTVEAIDGYWFGVVAPPVRAR